MDNREVRAFRQLRTTGRLFCFYLLPDFSLQSFSSAIEALRLANEVVGYEAYSWRVVSEDGNPVISSCGVLATPDVSLQVERDRLPRGAAPSMSVVCGGSSIPDACKPLHAWLRECRNRRMGLAGLGSGVFVLARAGLANGRQCAVHWEQFPVLSEEFPDIEAVQTAYEMDGDTHTCSGGDSSFDMFLRFVEEDHGFRVVSRVCEKAIAYRIRESGERQRLPLQTRVGIDNAALITVIEQMAANMAQPMTLAKLAEYSGLSRRQIERLFLQEFGRSPARYYMEMRLERAHSLILNSSLTVTDIAMACGFVSPSHFSKTYREHYGHSPQQARIAATERRKIRYAALPGPSAMPLQAVSA